MMASHIKKEDEDSSDLQELTSQATVDHTYSHNPDEFIDIHGSHCTSQTSSGLESENLSPSDQTDSKVFQETSDSFLQSSSKQNTTHGLKLPVQESEGMNTGGTVVHHNSDEEYQSAESGDTSDDEEDDFIPTTEMLSLDEQSEIPKETSTSETHISDGSGDADESEGEDILTVPEEDEVEEVDLLEARKELEKSLTPEEKEVSYIRNFATHFQCL